MYNNSNSVRKVPKDLGAFQKLVTGWEQVGSRSQTPVTPARDVLSPMSDMNEMINIGLPLQSPTNTSKSSVLKEQFLRDLSPTPTPTTPHSNAITPTTPTYGGSSYRFAGVERLAQRQKIYEPQISSPEARKENLSVSLGLSSQIIPLKAVYRSVIISDFNCHKMDYYLQNISDCFRKLIH